MIYTDKESGNFTVHSNFTSPPSCDFDPNEAAKITSRIQKIVIPIICAFGLIGNIIASIVFLSKSQRKTSCCLYLGARSISDTVFLMAVLIVNVTDLGVNIFNNHGICQIVIFLTYICGFLSVWFVVMVTVENYIRICHPFSVNDHCNTKTATIVIICFVVISLALYNFPLWTTGLQQVRGNYQCLRLMEYDTINQIVAYGDTVITLVIPTFMIIFLMIAITYSILESLHRQARLKGKTNNGYERRQSSPQSKVTRLLFAVSFIFVILTLPSHIIRVQMTIKYLYNSVSFCKTMVELAAQHVFNVLYYVSFAINIFIYLSFGDKFRAVFHTIFIKRLFHSKGQNSSESLPLNNTQSNRNTCLQSLQVNAKEQKELTQVNQLNP